MTADQRTRIAKLINLAERASTPAEAAAAFAKASALMVRYSIDLEELSAPADSDPVCSEILFVGGTNAQTYQVGFARITTALYHGAVCSYGTSQAHRDSLGISDPTDTRKGRYIYLVGHRSDTAAAKEFLQSVYRSAENSRKRWLKDTPAVPGRNPRTRSTSYILGYLEGVHSAVSSAAVDTHGTLVLASRAERVRAAVPGVLGTDPTDGRPTITYTSHQSLYGTDRYHGFHAGRSDHSIKEKGLTDAT